MNLFNFKYVKKLFKEDFLLLYIRFLFVISKFHLFFEPLSAFLLRLVYRSKFSKWLSTHPCKRFDDINRNNKYSLYQFIFDTENLQGEIDYLEFGVSGGNSLKWWVEKNKNPQSRFIGFDTFTGLPEKWDSVPKGSFATSGIPPLIEDIRCKYEIGLFQETLPGFVKRFNLNRRTVIHIDSDLYSSALFALTSLAPKLKNDDIIIFDELGSIRHPTHEFRAFCDFISAYKFNYKVIGAANFYYQVAIKLI